MRHKVLSLAVIVFGVAQSVRFETSNPPIQGDLIAPPEIASALRTACYNCHSNETQWPWYSALAPASWLVHYDVSEGRRRLNFSHWDDYAYDPGTRTQKLEEIQKLVRSGEMPPWYYRAVRSESCWSEGQRDVVIRWAAAEAAAPPATP